MIEYCDQTDTNFDNCDREDDPHNEAVLIEYYEEDDHQQFDNQINPEKGKILGDVNTEYDA